MPRIITRPRRVIALTFGLMAICLLAPMSAVARGIPDAWFGVWAKGSCKDPELVYLVGWDKVMRLDLGGPILLPEVGAAVRTHDAITMLRSNGLMVLLPVSQMSRCDELPELAADRYGNEIANFGILYDPPRAGLPEQKTVFEAIARYRMGLTTENNEAAVELLSGALLDYSRFVDRAFEAQRASGEAPNSFARLVVAQEIGGGIPLDYDAADLTSHMRTSIAAIPCRGAELGETGGAENLESLLRSSASGVCLRVQGIDDLGDTTDFLTHLQCEGPSVADLMSACGLTLEDRDGEVVILDVAFQSNAQAAGLDWDQIVLEVGPAP